MTTDATVRPRTIGHSCALVADACASTLKQVNPPSPRRPVAARIRVGNDASVRYGSGRSRYSLHVVVNRGRCSAKINDENFVITQKTIKVNTRKAKRGMWVELKENEGESLKELLQIMFGIVCTRII